MPPPRRRNWQEFSRRASNLTSLVVDPPDGRVPALTPEAQALRASTNALRNRRPETWTDRSMYDRCITRGVIGSAFPVIYGNGTQIVQTPGWVAIRYEMIHETRLIPLDGRPHAAAGVKTYMGDARGHWEGNTLVVETTNFVGGHNGAGVNGNGAAPYSDELRLGRTLHPRRRQDHSVFGDHRRSENLHRSLDRRVSHHSGSGLPDLRIRLP